MLEIEYVLETDMMVFEDRKDVKGPLDGMLRGEGAKQGRNHRHHRRPKWRIEVMVVRSHEPSMKDELGVLDRKA